MGGGAGISFTCQSEDLRMEDVAVTILNGKMKFSGINNSGEFLVSVDKFDAKGYQDGMSDVNGDVLNLTASFPPGFKENLQKQVNAVMGNLREDVFKPASEKDITTRRKNMPITISFEIDRYSGELSDVIGGGYSRPGANGVEIEWKDVGVKAVLEMDWDNNSAELDGFSINIYGRLNGARGISWYNAVFFPPDFDPGDYEGNDDPVSEEMHWDMYWEDIAQEYGA